MPDIVLSTLNAKYIHCAFGLRYLFANLGPLKPRACLREFDIKHPPTQVADELLAMEPKIIGLGVYLWNVEALTEIVRLLKNARPELIVILGGPEVSFDIESQEICRLADFVIAGEGDLAFAELCASLLDGRRPPDRILRPPPPDLERLALPYGLYDASDLAHRLVYVETSRGCPYECEYCISALEKSVRYFPLPALFSEFDRLLASGLRLFKFTDRTFNLSIERCLTVMDFFLQRMVPDLVLHLEMVPDHFPPALRSMIQRFPDGTLQFEIGVQTLNEDVARRIRRKQNAIAVEENFRFLREKTGAWIHADLIAGLPGESMESFASGFNRVVSWRPQELQLGILKRLRGAPIARHDEEWAMKYSAEPPYEIIENRMIDQATMDRIKRFARYWELVVNRGRFPTAAPMIWQDAASAFDAFMEFSDAMHAHFGRDHSISLSELVEGVFEYLKKGRGMNAKVAAEALWQDYRGEGRQHPPKALRAFLNQE